MKIIISEEQMMSLRLRRRGAELEKIGDIIEWRNQNMSFKVVITYVNKYKSFREMITTEGLGNVLPGIDSIDSGVAVYRKFYDENREKNSGVLAIGMKVL